ncbi:hypothetical protein JCM10212_001415 [Sporobolomyces blumeae]
MSADLKNVVIVGLGLAGTHALEALHKSLPPSHRIIAISPLPGYWPVAALRAAVVPGYERNTLAPLDRLLPDGSRHVIIQGSSVEQLKDHTVVLDKAHPEFGAEIEFDYCIVATGSSYPFPCRPPKNATSNEIVDQFKTLQDEVARSTSILILGGGPVGIEFAGEVSEYYDGRSSGRDKKQITLVHGGKAFIEEEGYKPKLGASLKNQLEKAGVKLVFGEKVDLEGRGTGKLDEMTEFKLSNGDIVKADFLFVAFGNAPNTSLFSDLDSSTLEESTKRVKVSPSFQVERHPSLFAVGDITSIPESKLYHNASKHGAVVAQNICALVSAGEQGTANLKEYKAGGAMMGVSVGSKGGAGQFFGFVAGPWIIAFGKSKHLFVPVFKQLYHAS